jgi:hypothetical protein
MLILKTAQQIPNQIAQQHFPIGDRTIYKPDGRHFRIATGEVHIHDVSTRLLRAVQMYHSENNKEVRKNFLR